jgi:hypothetical protein
MAMSQIGTRDTTKMTFPTELVRLINKDLYKKDFLDSTNVVLWKRINILEDKILKHADIITSFETKSKNDSIINAERKFQLSLKDELNEGLKKDIKKSNRQTTLYKITTGAAIILSIFIAVK